ncbi:MAG TPA: hypothetical protein VGP12_11035 [Nitrosospira sp.]|nr:hypothetical protein [Nitrosospira sp.]
MSIPNTTGNDFDHFDQRRELVVQVANPTDDLSDLDQVHRPRPNLQVRYRLGAVSQIFLVGYL